MKILDIGCGRNKHENTIGIDHHKVEGVDAICDIEDGLPFKDNIFDKIYCSHILEHVRNFFNGRNSLHF